MVIETKLKSCAIALKSRCINTLGSISTVGSYIDTVSLRGPGLRPNRVLGEVDLNDLVRSLYFRPDLDVGAFTAAWPQWAEKMTHGTKGVAVQIHRWLAEAFPSVPLRRGDGRALLIQALVLASWHGGQLKINDNQVELKIGGRTLRVDRGAADWGTARRRWWRAIEFKIPDALRIPTGRPRPLGIRGGALYRWLLTGLPDLHVEINVVFSVAAQVGLVETLIDQFDVDQAITQPIMKGQNDVWFRVRNIIMTSTEWPMKAITRELSRLYPATVVWYRFCGNATPDVYSAHWRDRLLRVALEMEAERIAEVKGRPDTTAHDLIQLQEMIRG